VALLEEIGPNGYHFAPVFVEDSLSFDPSEILLQGRGAGSWLDASACPPIVSMAVER
jgi:hypothetical protein